MLAQLLDVSHQIPGRIIDEACVGPALAAAALVEEHDAVLFGIEEAPHPGVGAAARTAMQEHRGLALGIAAFLEIKLVQVRDFEITRAVGPDRRIQSTSFHTTMGPSGLPP